ncbi:hypothetical protein FJZ26_01545 [Candidatus Parvarchaeota archaeon]|nr:hypothetical protein [Candidatus Parvarchaeota archaeon]
MLLYFYDLHASDEKKFNQIKRRFYYQFNKSNLSKCALKTKSVLYIDDIYESEADSFFKQFAGQLVAHKTKCESIEQIV